MKDKMKGNQKNFILSAIFQAMIYRTQLSS
jgi:hypothetical protein